MQVSFPGTTFSDMMLGPRGQWLASRLGSPEKARQMLKRESAKMIRFGDLLAAGVSVSRACDIVAGVTASPAQPKGARLQDARERLNAVRRDVAHCHPTWRTASHEAGHAVCAVAFDFRGLSIARNIETASEAGSVTINRLNEENPLKVLALAYGGPIAAAWSQDKSADRASLDSGGDLAIARWALNQWNNRDEQIKQLRQAKSLACDTLRQHAKALDVIARELVVRRWLDADELRRIVRDN